MSNLDNSNNNFLNNQINVSKTEEEDSKNFSLNNIEYNPKLDKSLKNKSNFDKKVETYKKRIDELTLELSLLKSDFKTIKNENESLKEETELNKYEKEQIEKLREKEKIMNEEKYNDLEEKSPLCHIFKAILSAKPHFKSSDKLQRKELIPSISPLVRE